MHPILFMHLKQHWMSGVIRLPRYILPNTSAEGKSVRRRLEGRHASEILCKMTELSDFFFSIVWFFYQTECGSSFECHLLFCYGLWRQQIEQIIIWTFLLQAVWSTMSSAPSGDISGYHLSGERATSITDLSSIFHMLSLRSCVSALTCWRLHCSSFKTPPALSPAEGLQCHKAFN